MMCVTFKSTNYNAFTICIRVFEIYPVVVSIDDYVGDWKEPKSDYLGSAGRSVSCRRINDTTLNCSFPNHTDIELHTIDRKSITCITTSCFLKGVPLKGNFDGDEQIAWYSGSNFVGTWKKLGRFSIIDPKHAFK